MRGLFGELAKQNIRSHGESSPAPTELESECFRWGEEAHSVFTAASCSPAASVITAKNAKRKLLSCSVTNYLLIRCLSFNYLAHSFFCCSFLVDDRAQWKSDCNLHVDLFLLTALFHSRYDCTPALQAGGSTRHRISIFMCLLKTSQNALWEEANMRSCFLSVKLSHSQLANLNMQIRQMIPVFVINRLLWWGGNQDCDSSMINGHFCLIYDEKVGHYAHIILPWLYLFDQ